MASRKLGLWSMGGLRVVQDGFCGWDTSLLL